MKAAVVTSFTEPPHYQDFALPAQLGEHEIIVEVLAAGLHPRVRAQADGTHYTSTDQLPLVPGIDGVGRTAEGALVYFVLPDTSLGSMAQQTVIDTRRSIELAQDADPIQIAAAMNPAMSSWIALRRRISFTPGQNVLVLGATGSAGRLAVQVAKTLGAGHVTAVGRGVDALRLLEADVTVALESDKNAVTNQLGDAAKDVDVVIDYLWGEPTHDAMSAIIPRRTDDAQSLAWIQVGSVAGAEAAIPAAALRATRLQIVGSGQGSVSTRGIVAELSELAKAVSGNAFMIEARRVRLEDIERTWTEPATSQERIVVVPQPLPEQGRTRPALA